MITYTVLSGVERPQQLYTHRRIRPSPLELAEHLGRSRRATNLNTTIIHSRSSLGLAHRAARTTAPATREQHSEEASRRAKTQRQS